MKAQDQRWRRAQERIFTFQRAHGIREEYLRMAPPASPWQAFGPAVQQGGIIPGAGVVVKEKIEIFV